MAQNFRKNPVKTNEIRHARSAVLTGWVPPGLKHADIKAARIEGLPPPGPYLAARSAIRARNALVAAREQIDAALQQIDVWELKRDE